MSMGTSISEFWNYSITETLVTVNELKTYQFAKTHTHFITIVYKSTWRINGKSHPPNESILKYIDLDLFWKNFAGVPDSGWSMPNNPGCSWTHFPQTEPKTTIGIVKHKY